MCRKKITIFAFLLGSMFFPKVVETPSTLVTTADRRIEAAPFCDVRSFLSISLDMSHGVASFASAWVEEKRCVTAKRR